ncbi:DNA polymerase III subunit alpha [Luteitalea sp.]|uniref:DNA polymerase III subunit alpha n=1 Tax=Luteitalea sp. TaxID=2004800 RepID=UPI0025C62640|nr:DNA polymerase III subunit alpha [Luteitalea sp.]
MKDFVHLHLHTEYSLLDGACRVDELMKEAARLGMPSLAVTEHGNMFSSVIFYDTAKKHGVRPILGCEVYVAPGDRRERSGVPGETQNHLVLLAENNVGYHNLIKLVSSGYTEGFYYKPRIDKELLQTHSAGLIGLSSCLKGEVAEGIYKDKIEKARTAAGQYAEIFGKGNFFLEMQYQGLREQKIVNDGLPGLARELDLPMVITNDVHYLRNGDHKPHDILLCIGTGKSVNDAHRLKYGSDEFYLKTPEQMWERFGEYPDALTNTARIAERCHVNLDDKKYHLPNFDVPAGETLDGHFERITREGFAGRLPRLQDLIGRGALRHSLDEYAARLDYEIAMIQKMGYTGYFLIVWDFIRYAREQGIPVGPGRGSAAGSVVAWCLRITDVDPIEFDLIFERFLNPERVSMPDIDIDFCERRRGEVIEYVTRKYGRENVAQIITFGTMKAKAVVRDVGRVLDMTYAEVDKVAKLIPPALDMTLEKALVENPLLKQLRDSDPKVRELLEIGQRLEGMTRHASVHAAGVVIAPSAITDYAPLYKGARDEIVTQWAMKEIERMGLLKMDFLGLSTLTLIDDALKEIKRTRGETLDIDAIPMDDLKTYALFADGQTAGVFQFESSGMREVLRKAKPSRFDDLIALNALYRPGPLGAGVVDSFVNRRHGREQITYMVPQMEPILSDTYGVIAYQEQVMRVARDVGGFTMGEADVLRKAMGKKDPKVMAAQRDRFVQGAIANTLSEKKAGEIFDLLAYFAGYGFNKSHSTTYALLAYQTGYLKANYPRYFMAALLTIEAQNTDKLSSYLGECRDLGVPVLPPDVNLSQLPFTVEPEGVRFGLTAVKNVGEGAILSILAVRAERGGRIDSLRILCEHADLRLVNKRVLESLAKAGALDSLAPADEPITSRRARLCAAIDRALEHGNRIQKDRDRGQTQLFDALLGGGEDDGDASTTPDLALPDADPWPTAQVLAFEKEALGLYLSGHPLTAHQEDLAKAGAKPIAQCTEAAADVLVGGIIGGVRHVKTKKGDRMAAFMLEDLDGSLEVVAFPETFRNFGQAIENDRMVLVRGKLEAGDDTPKILASEIKPLSSLNETLSREVAISLKTPSRMMFEAVADVLLRHRGDRRVRLDVEIRDLPRAMRVRAELAAVQVRPSEQLVADLERVCGVGAVKLR